MAMAVVGGAISEVHIKFHAINFTSYSRIKYKAFIKESSGFFTILLTGSPESLGKLLVQKLLEKSSETIYLKIIDSYNVDTGGLCIMYIRKHIPHT